MNLVRVLTILDQPSIPNPPYGLSTAFTPLDTCSHYLFPPTNRSSYTYLTFAFA